MERHKIIQKQIHFWYCQCRPRHLIWSKLHTHTHTSGRTNNKQSASSCLPCREPMPGAGGHHPDQAKRAHRGPAQSRRHRQHHHAGGHSLRNELLHRAVDTAQEIQTHHQYLLRRFALLLKVTHPKFLTHLETKHVYTQVFAYTFGPNQALGGWEIIKERKALPFPAPPKTQDSEEHFCTFCLVVPLTLFIVSLFKSPSIPEWCCGQKGWESEQNYSHSRHLSTFVLLMYKHVTCLELKESRLYFSVWMWHSQLIFDIWEQNHYLWQKRMTVITQ